MIYGLTASAFLSLSIDPPQVLVCINRHASLHRVLEQVDAFAVNVLREQQQELSEYFATPGRQVGPEFPNVASHEDVSGAPILDGALAYFDCAIAERLPGADHTIFIGAVTAVGADSAGLPLIYFNRAYRAVRDLDAESSG
jgi:flavin reductase (DIM6/NTAB) family NADH-FMN oxidoreductase RutF